MRDDAFGVVVEKTNAFVTIATASCAYNVYQEWQEAISGMAAVWSTAGAVYTRNGDAATLSLSRSIEAQILESRFAVAAALRNGGRFCRKYADAEYRGILSDFRSPEFGFARDRARVGIDDVRALPTLPPL
jgi:hypothetical protein